jgi:hypothetical protein
MSRFEGKLVLVLLDDRDHPSIRGGRSLWGVEQPLSYLAGAGADQLISVPAGFVTDLASIPRLVWSFFPPDGPWAKAAVIHDYLYATKGTGNWKGHLGVVRAAPYTRAEADGILREAMADRQVGGFERAVIWTAVRLGGGAGWGH